MNACRPKYGDYAQPIKPDPSRTLRNRRVSPNISQSPPWKSRQRISARQLEKPKRKCQTKRRLQSQRQRESAAPENRQPTGKKKKSKRSHPTMRRAVHQKWLYNPMHRNGEISHAERPAAPKGLRQRIIQRLMRFQPKNCE